MEKNYYIILGVSPGATRKRIKRAYRDLAKRYHPDSGSTEISEAKFKELQKAYETLSDSGLRSDYDAELARRISPYSHAVPESIVEERNAPLSGHFGRRSNVHDLTGNRVSRRYAAGFRGRINRELAVEMILSPSEARHGGLFPLAFPGVEPCAHCNQSGFQYPFICPNCRGRGYFRSVRRFSVSVPPHTQNGTEVILPLDDIGMRGVHLYIRIRVDTDPLY
jgi:molecular chaperone DnaJ